MLIPEDLGRVVLINTTISFFAMFMINPIGMFINRRLHDWTIDGRCRIYFNLFGVYIVFVSIFSIFTIAIMVIAIPKFNVYKSNIDFVLVGALIAFGAAIQTLIPSLNLLGKWIPYTVLNLGVILTSLFFSILFCVTINTSAEHWLAGTVVGQAIFSVISYLYFFKNLRNFKYSFKPSNVQINSLISFSWPISISVGLQWIYMQGYRFLMADNFDPEQFGLFAAGYTLAAALLAAFESLLTTRYQPEFYRDASSNNVAVQKAAWSFYAARMIPGAILACTALIATSDILPKLFLGSKYHEVGRFVLIGCFAELGRILVGIFVLNSHQNMETKKLIIPYAVGASLFLLGLASTHESLGNEIIVTPILAVFACLAVLVVLCWRDLRMDISKIMNNRVHLFYSVILFILAFIIKDLILLMQISNFIEVFIVVLLVYLGWFTIAYFMHSYIIR